jgi:hypothetical protein
MIQQRHHHALLLALLLGATPWGLVEGYAAPVRKVDSIQLLREELNTLRQQSATLQKELREERRQGSIREQRLHQQAQSLDSLQTKIEGLQVQWKQATQDLKTSIDTKHSAALSETHQVSTSLDHSRWGGLALGLLLAFVGGVGYSWLRRRQTKAQESVEQKTQALQQEISHSRTELEAQIVQELSKQSQLLEEQSAKLQVPSPATMNVAPDHSLALKLAGEITTIERNISFMDEGTRGLKQLRRSVGKLKDNLLANGYEMPELLHQKYVQGMNVIVVTTHQDDTLEAGVELISKVLVPQVNYQGKLIQAPQVEISIG